MLLNVHLNSIMLFLLQRIYEKVYSVCKPALKRLRVHTVPTTKAMIWKRFVTKLGLGNRFVLARMDIRDVMLVRPRYYDDIIALFGRPAEQWITKLFESLERGAIIIDVGAHIGRYTLLGAKSVGTSGRVVAVEPHPENLKILSKNVELNGYFNVICINSCLSDEEGFVNLFLGADSGLHSIDSRWFCSYSGKFSVSNGVEVISKTLDSLLNELEIEKVDLVKIDVEGAEMRVIKGAEKQLDKRGILRIICEVHAPAVRVKDVEDFLCKYGFKTKTKHNFVYAYLGDSQLSRP